MPGTFRDRWQNAFQSLREWNARRRHLPDIHEKKHFHTAASVLTRIGFVAKAVLYGSMGAIAMIVASGNPHYSSPEGPQSVLGTLGANTAGKVFVALLVVGLFCYAAFALMFSILDFDRLGHHGAFPVLARFGRLFSAGFYAFIGVAGIEVLVNIKNNGSTSTSLGNSLFETGIGQAVLCFLGVVFIVVAIVYLSYIFKPAKFRRELASERMPPVLFHICVTIARIGAVGRILFFGTFGVILIDAVANNRGATVNGTSILGLEGVLQKLANASPVLLFLTGGFLFVYAIWAFVLCIYRRLPAHYSEEEALAAVGMRWRAKKAEKALAKQLQEGTAMQIFPSHGSSLAPSMGAAVVDSLPIATAIPIGTAYGPTDAEYAQRLRVADEKPIGLSPSESIVYAYPMDPVPSESESETAPLSPRSRPVPSPNNLSRLRGSANLHRRSSLVNSTGEAAR